MNKGPELSFISLQVDYWDGPWQNRQGFVSELAKKAKVLFVSPPLHLEQVIRPRSKQRTAMAGLQHVEHGLWSYVPPRFLPVNHRLRALERGFRRLRQRRLQRVCHELSMTQPATILFHPHAAPVVLESLSRPIIYYKYDHYAGYGGVPAERQRFVDERERRLFDFADLVFVTSSGLLELHRTDAPNRIHLLPNGVDYPAFSGAQTLGSPLPDDLVNIPRPRLGYVGQINEKINLRLLRDLASRRRDYSFVLAGTYRSRDSVADEAFHALIAEPNVYFLGQKPHKQIPNYLAGLDVGLMPYVLTEWVRFGYPLKLHEYLATGLPSVSSVLPELEPFRDVVTLADSNQEWLEAIDAAVRSGTDAALKEKRRSIARANSWEVRVDKFLRIVSPLCIGQHRELPRSSL